MYWPIVVQRAHYWPIVVQRAHSAQIVLSHSLALSDLHLVSTSDNARMVDSLQYIT
jgi:hypothetical protein